MENKTEKIITNSRIPFSQRLFWSIFFIFLGFTGCVLIFQYQRETEFAQEKLDTVLKTYNYQIHYRIQHEKGQETDSIIHSFLDEIPQKDIRVTVINPEGDVLFDNSGNDIFENHNDRRGSLKRALPSANRRRRERDTSTRLPTSTIISTGRPFRMIRM